MLSSTAQISLKGALEAMLTWKTFKMNKPSAGISNKKRDIFHIVMTPDRIPKFIIPSLEVDHILFHIEPVEAVPDVKKEIHTAQQEAVSPRAKRSHSESNIKKVHLLRGRSLCRKASEYFPAELEKVADHSDPPTRAALSLPHLPKFTTPYGFLTLGESPHIRRKESLYFDLDASEIPTVPSMKKNSASIPRNASNPLQGHKDCPNTPRKPARSISWEVLCCTPPNASFSSPSNSKRCSSKCEKKKFNFLRRKQLPGVICLNSNGKTREKVPVTVGRTRSNPIA